MDTTDALRSLMCTVWQVSTHRRSVGGAHDRSNASAHVLQVIKSGEFEFMLKAIESLQEGGTLVRSHHETMVASTSTVPTTTTTRVGNQIESQSVKSKTNAIQVRDIHSSPFYHLISAMDLDIVSDPSTNNTTEGGDGKVSEKSKKLARQGSVIMMDLVKSG